jgi:hypothetical protein
LYNKIWVKILINGHLCDSIDIKRGYTYGDAFICAFFILGIDPIIPTIIRDPVIRIAEIKTKRTNTEVKCKAGAYADDVRALCRGDRSVQRMFEQHEKLTHRSGLKLNAEKTVILALNKGRSLTYDKEYCEQRFFFQTVVLQKS